jgi:hypothetical protein
MANIYPIQKKDGNIDFRSRGTLTKRKPGAGKRVSSKEGVQWSSCVMKSGTEGGGDTGDAQTGNGSGGGYMRVQGVQFASVQIGNEGIGWAITPHFITISRPCNPEGAGVMPEQPKNKSGFRLKSRAELARQWAKIKSDAPGDAAGFINGLVNEAASAAQSGMEIQAGLPQNAHDLMHNVGYANYAAFMGLEGKDGLMHMWGEILIDTAHGDLPKYYDSEDFNFGDGTGEIWR